MLPACLPLYGGVPLYGGAPLLGASAGGAHSQPDESQTQAPLHGKEVLNNAVPPVSRLAPPRGGHATCPRTSPSWRIGHEL
jgi:hypothetical protein